MDEADCNEARTPSHAVRRAEERMKNDLGFARQLRRVLKIFRLFIYTSLTLGRPKPDPRAALALSYPVDATAPKIDWREYDDC
jgi:hypothetical protein